MFWKKKKEEFEYEFLPAALEIEETPPSPGGKFIVRTIFIIIIVAAAWSIIAKTDKVAVARGKIIPLGKAKVIEPFEEGVVKIIAVKEGDKVKKGELLVSLDTTINSANTEELREYLSALYLEDYLLKEILKGNGLDSIKKLHSNKMFSELSRTEIDYHQELQNTRHKGHREKVMIQKHILTQRKSELEIAETILKKLSKRYKVLKSQEKMYEKLHKKGSVSEQTWIEKKSETESLEHEIIAQKVEVQRCKYKIDEGGETLSLIKKQWRTENLQELVETEKKIRSTASQLKKAERKLHLRNLYSPVDGIINQIEVTTVGEMVSPAQAIMTIVPDNLNRIAEVSVLNHDIGFIHKGQKAEIKLDTFPFHKYGIIEGEVINVSPDAVVDQKTGMLTYEVFVKPDKNSIKIGDRIVKLTPGMTLTVEIKTGTRRIIEYFLDPVMKFKNEAFRQR
jgi:hemolysin D